MEDAWKYADEFFDQPDDIKMKYKRSEADDHKYGWEPLGAEKLV